MGTSLQDFIQPGSPEAQSSTHISDIPPAVPPPPEDHPHGTWAQGQLINIENMFLAGQQHTTDNMTAHSKNYVADMSSADDSGRAYYKGDDGKEVASDPKKHVVMIDPSDGNYKIYNRSEETDRGVAAPGITTTPEQGVAQGKGGVGVNWGGGTQPVNLEALGKWFMMGMGPERPGQTAMPSGAASAAQAAARQGIDVPQGLVSPSTGVQSRAKVLAKMPWVGTPLRDATTKMQQQTANRLGQVQDQLSSTGDVLNPAEAGAQTRQSFEAWKRAEFAENGTIDRKYDDVSRLVDPKMKQRMDKTWDVVQPIQAKYANTRLAGGESAAVNTVLDTIRKPGGLNFDEMRFARTYIGKLIENPGELSQGLNEGELKQIYGGLSDDMNRFMQRNPRALRTWEDAEKYTKDAHDTRRSLDAAFGNTSGRDEGLFSQIVRYASSKDTGNIAALAKAKNVMAEPHWQDVGASVIDRISRTKEGVFDPAQFAKGYATLSDEGKNLLFGAKGTAHRQALDDIAEVVSETSRNASTMTHAAAGHGLGIGATTAGMIEGLQALREGVTAGHASRAAAAVGVGVGSNIYARLLASPAGAIRLARWAKQVRNTGASGIGASGLTGAARSGNVIKGEPDAEDAFGELQKYVNDKYGGE